MDVGAYMNLVTRVPARRFALIIQILADMSARLPAGTGDGPLATRLARSGGFASWFTRAASDLEDVPFETLVRNLVMGVMVEGHSRRQRFALKHGYYGPAMISVEITGDSGRMDARMLGSILDQARDLGSYLVVLDGPDPLSHPDLGRVISEHDDLSFIAHVPASSVSPAAAAGLVARGNLWLSVIVDAATESGDALRAAELLHRAGVVFGCTVEQESATAHAVSQEGFIDPWIGCGALFVWGRRRVEVLGGDVSRMPSAAQRDAMRRTFRAWQRTRPVVVVDPCTDGSCLGGCLAASRTLHVQADGRVIPCPCVRFTPRGVAPGALAEALGSRFFEQMRLQQPCDENLLRLCPVTDHPDILRDLLDRCEPEPSVEGACEALRAKELVKLLDGHGREWADIAHGAWANEYGLGREVELPFLGCTDVRDSFPSRMQQAHLVTETRRAMRLGYDPAARKKRLAVSMPGSADLLGG